MLRSVLGEKMNMHPKSVLMHTECFPSPLVMYHIRQKSTSLYIHDGTVVFPLSLVFFGDQFRYKFIKPFFLSAIEEFLEIFENYVLFPTGYIKVVKELLQVFQLIQIWGFCAPSRHQWPLRIWEIDSIKFWNGKFHTLDTSIGMLIILKWKF